jgi:hypothetical protein
MNTLHGLALALPQPTSTNAGIVSAIAACITAAGGFVLAVGVLIPILRNSRRALVNTAAAVVKVDAVVAQVGEVHTIVNQQRTDAHRYQVALIRALREGGLDVPVDQALDSIPALDADPRTLSDHHRRDDVPEPG